MEARELMIGNYIYGGKDGKTIFKVLSEDFSTIESFPENYFGIPLTEQLLMDLGFESTYDSHFRAKFDHIEHSEIGFDYSKGKPMGMEGFRYYGRYIKIEFVHQLQNLYYSLTGQELTYKQNTLS